VGHSTVAGFYESQGRLRDALEAYTQALEVFKRLAAMDPSNLGWQREVVVALSGVARAGQVQEGVE
jgi:hypothetical protein